MLLQRLFVNLFIYMRTHSKDSIHLDAFRGIHLDVEIEYLLFFFYF